MARLNLHPAPGFGELVPGFFVVPQNPLRLAEQGGVVRISRIGELMPAKFSVPENPLIEALSGGKPGCCANCGGGGGCAGMAGIELPLVGELGWGTLALVGLGAYWLMVRRRRG